MGASQGSGDVQGASNGTLSGTVSAPSAADQAEQDKKKKALSGLGSGIAAGLSSLDQQPQQVAAGPQLGAGLPQAQATDPYQQYILSLQQQQTPFFGN